MGEVRPLGQISRGHVYHQFREPGVCDQAHELSRPYPGVQPGVEELPGPAPAFFGIRFLSPERGFGNPAWFDAGQGFTQDDAHIFCTEDQVQDEVSDFIDLLFEVYRDFGFDDVLMKLSTRPENRVGSDAVWDKSEQALEQALSNKGVEWELQPGEGAFYGPKIDFSLKDSIGRVWQCGTIQADFSMPGRLGAHYVDGDSRKQAPVMLHRAILGSLERFIGIIIEHYAGSFPPWLAPVQVVVASITENQTEYALSLAETLKDQGFRVDTDLRNETISLKIREHAMQRVPYQLIIGAREAENNMVAVRTRGGEDLGLRSLSDFTDRLNEDIACLGRVTGGITYRA